MRPSVASQGKAAFGSGGVAVKPIVPVSTPKAPKGNAGTDQKRAAVNRKRREEAELRVLWEQEADRCQVLQLRIQETEKAMAQLTKQLEAQMEQQSTEKAKITSELMKWIRREEELSESVKSKQKKLHELEERVRRAKQRNNESRLAFISLFLRKDMVPDVTLEDILSDEGFAFDASSFEQEQQDQAPAGAESENNGGIRPRRSPARKKRNSVGDMEDASEDFISEDQRQSIEQMRSKTTAAVTKGPKDALEEAAEELRALLKEEDDERKAEQKRLRAEAMRLEEEKEHQNSGRFDTYADDDDYSSDKGTDTAEGTELSPKDVLLQTQSWHGH